MIRKQSHILCVGLTLFFFISSIYFVTYRLVKKSPSGKTTYVENFTPGIREMVRPQLRNARLVTEEYREYFTDKTNESLKMLGLQFV